MADISFTTDTTYGFFTCFTFFSFCANLKMVALRPQRTKGVIGLGMKRRMKIGDLKIDLKI